MTAPSTVEVLTEIQRQHEFDSAFGTCTGCHWVARSQVKDRDGRLILWHEQHLVHVAEVVAADPRIAVVALPEATVDTQDCHNFSDGTDEGTTRAHPGDGVVYSYNWEWTSEQAEAVGANWIAAARVAGPNSTVGGDAA